MDSKSLCCFAELSVVAGNHVCSCIRNCPIITVALMLLIIVATGQTYLPV
ncbi:hypothetical protein [Clostridium sp. AM33-3]|nr:hypothetical protein [Clostridium sp. AM33-3]